ncbi:polysaccharide deacetylase family protein [Chengkuizengella sediminis]|uniref:polysaccharide deacetylase family protein n=1 Tax=Chengkuizengella sediminis TaxID=1885917 RepID=UPI001389534E|nr:polysaccharide deacetylase family protein [Chengkuizengella sediminis]NDI34749.1 polysaccharide deacetylase [Chengkuizengella sediminis]
MFKQPELLTGHKQEKNIQRTIKPFKIKKIAILLFFCIFVFISLQQFTFGGTKHLYSSINSENNILTDATLQPNIEISDIKPTNSLESSNIEKQNDEVILNSEKLEDITYDHKNENKKMVYLTFDDGPRAVSNDILQLLKEYDVQATFFMLEPSMRKYAESVQQMVADGHSVGLHGVTHNKNSFYASRNSVISEMNLTQQTLEEITGITSFLIRTPYGSRPYMTDEYMNEVSENNYLLWDWNIDSLDWKFRNEQYVNHVITQIKQKEGSEEPVVILLHEIPETLQSLPLLLDYLEENGYGFGKLNERMEPVQF